MSSGFYALINTISGTRFVPGAADFRGLSRQAVDALKAMPEYHRFLRGMISWMGYRSVILPYHETQPCGRQIQIFLWQNVPPGNGRDLFFFPYTALYRHDAGRSFALPCRGADHLCAFLLADGPSSELVAGWSSLMSVTLVIGGMVMILLGFIGVYIGYIFQEVKRRPVYLLKKGEK